MKSLEFQVGGDHYKDLPIQPLEFIYRNKLSFPVGNIIKYLCRFERKNGMEDLEKAKHYIDFMIESYKKDQKQYDQVSVIPCGNNG